MTKTKAEVRARIDDRMLVRAGTLFDQSMRSIAGELIQNARRAGATQIECWTEPGLEGSVAVFQDDGRGVDELALLVELGGSGWDDASSPVEERAGMGLFTLASRGCAVTSGGRVINLAPEVFAGAEAPAARATGFRAGTTVRFPLRPGEEAAMASAIHAEGLYAPIPVRLDGKPIDQASFLDAADVVEKFEGVAIGIYAEASWCLRHARIHRMDAVLGWVDREINFGGHLVAAPDHDVVSGSWGNWRALWEVGEGSALRMVLPARDAVIEDDVWSRLIQHTLLLQCRMTRPGKLAMQWFDYARERGVRLKVPALDLIDLVKHQKQIEAEGDAYDNMMRNTANAVVLPYDWGKGARHAAYAVVKQQASGGLRVALGNPSLEGLERYDELPKLTSIRLAATWPNGTTQVIENLQDATGLEDPAVFARFESMIARAKKNGARSAPTKLEVTLLHRDARGTEGAIGPVEVPFVFVNGDSDQETEARRLASPQCARKGLMAAVLEEAAANYDAEMHEALDEDTEWRYTKGAHQADVWWDLASMAMPPDEYAVHVRRMDAWRMADAIRDAGLGNLVASAAIERPHHGEPDGSEDLVVTITMADGATASRSVRVKVGKKPKAQPMMEPDRLGRTVRGRVSARALEQAPAMFDQGLATIASELIQNARRAGATRVDVTATVGPQPRAVFTDDGPGIEDPQALVTLGGTQWRDGQAVGEDTAGMGSFSLAARGCIVESRDWMVSLTTSTFTGQEASPIRPRPMRTGTSISFPLLASDAHRSPQRAEKLRRAVVLEARHASIQVAFDGGILPAVDFLEGAERVVTYEGVRIGLFSTPFQRRSPNAGILPNDTFAARNAINFHGHMAAAPRAVEVPDGSRLIVARWDVQAGCLLRLVLPTRDKAVEDGAWLALRDATRIEACRLAAAEGPHQLDMADVAACRAAGFDPGLPEMVLGAWPSSKRNMPGELLADRGTLVVPRLAKGPAAIALEALALADGAPFLAMEAPWLVGHPEYDELPVVASVTVAIEGDGSNVAAEEAWSVEGEWLSLTGMCPQIVARITVTALCASGRTLAVGDVAFAEIGWDDGSDEWAGLLAVSQADAQTAQSASIAAAIHGRDPRRHDGWTDKRYQATLAADIMALDPSNANTLLELALDAACSAAAKIEYGPVDARVRAVTATMVPGIHDITEAGEDGIDEMEMEGADDFAEVTEFDGKRHNVTPWNWKLHAERDVAKAKR